jgi:2-C-methyl-D-erythritol 4-phosphate cytidylyltransferase
MLKKMFAAQSVEQEAIEAFTAKKKLQQQRDDLKTYIMFSQGTKAWDELLQTESNIRKQRKKLVYEAQQRREKLVGGLLVGLASTALVSIVGVLGYVIIRNL